MSSLPTLSEAMEEVAATLRGRGGLAAILIDLSGLERIERSFGPTAYETVRAQIEGIMPEIRERARPDDVLVSEGLDGDRYILFLTGERPETYSSLELSNLADRIEDFLAPRVGRLALAFSRERTRIDVGHAFLVFSPLANVQRQIRRLVDDARQSAEVRRANQEQRQREGLLEIIYNRRVWTAFQSIVEIQGRKIMGHEALSRGPRGTDLEPPLSLFGLAARHGLVEELERACRSQTFLDWDVFGGSGRLFVNTVPATVRDPSFLGRGIIEALGPTLSPRMVTLEITERQVIENLSLYREAMHSFLEMGFSFAIDDLGAGYSGLETLVNLGAAFLKIDMGLVRDVHLKKVSQGVVRAIVEMGVGVGATVIAEGIQTVEEADTLVGLGVRYGQGYLFGRPIDAQAAARAAAGLPRA